MRSFQDRRVDETPVIIFDFLTKRKHLSLDKGIKMTTVKFDYPDGEAKLKELMLYVADKCSQDPNFGATKLNKILWWANFLAFGKIRKPVLHR